MLTVTGRHANFHDVFDACSGIEFSANDFLLSLDATKARDNKHQGLIIECSILEFPPRVRCGRNQEVFFPIISTLNRSKGPIKGARLDFISGRDGA